VTANEPSYTEQVSEYVQATRFSVLPASATEAAKLVTLDLLGSALAGSTSGTAAAMIRYTGAVGGTPEASVIGSGLRTSMSNAGLANGAIAADAEMDDVHPDSNIHASSVFVPAMLAVCEARGASGRDYLNSLAMAYDIGCRVSEALGDADQTERGFHPTAISGVFGVVAGAAAVLDLTAQQVSEAIGLAGTQAAGLLTYKLEREHYAKSLHSGIAVRAGLAAAQLVQHGYRGPAGTLDGRANIFDAFSLSHRFAPLTDGLGQRYEIEHTGFKFYGCCRAIHGPLDLLLPLMNQGKVTAANVASIDVWLPARQVPVVDNNELVTHNLQYVLAVTLTDQGSFPDQLVTDRRRDPGVAGLMGRIRLVPDQEMNEVYPHHWPSRVRIVTESGDIFDEGVRDPRGNPGNPASRADLEGKFRSLVSDVLDPAAQDSLLAAVEALDGAGSVSAVTDLLRGPFPGR
jgi:2-methylcitrate dehydratase PrpD